MASFYFKGKLQADLSVLRGVDFLVKKCVKRAGERGETRAAAQQKKRGFHALLYP